MPIFIVVWAGQLVSTLGSGLTSFGLGVWIYQQTGSATLFAVNMLVWILPNIAMAPLAGVLADRWDRRLVMLLSDTGAGLSSLIIAIVLFTGRLEVWNVYLATFFNSAFTAFQWPAYSAATSLLVPKEQLGRASGMTQTSQAISSLIAPALAGALYVSVGMKAILMIDVVTYLVSVATLLAVRFPQLPPSEETQAEKGSFWREALFGWHYIRHRPGLLSLLIIFACMNFLFSLTYPLLTPMLLDLASPDLVGYTASIAGLGMLSGTLLLSIWGGPKRRILGIYFAETLAGMFALLTGVRPLIPMIAMAGFGLSMVLPISSGCSQAIWQSKVAPGVQGRVFSIRSMIAFSIIPLAYALAGPLAEQFFEPWMAQAGHLSYIFGPLIGVGPGRGIGLMFILVGAMYILLASLVLLLPRVRRLETELPDAVETAVIT